MNEITNKESLSNIHINHTQSFVSISPSFWLEVLLHVLLTSNTTDMNHNGNSGFQMYSHFNGFKLHHSVV